MSLYQCEECGCMENTALSGFHWKQYKKEPLTCSGCDGVWHSQFDRIYLPKGMFITNHEGNLAHKETGDTNVRKYALEPK